MLQAILEAATDFKDLAERLSLKLSGKAESVCSDLAIARKLSSKLARAGVSFKPASSARDLGVIFTAGTSVNRSAQQARINEARPRS